MKLIARLSNSPIAFGLTVFGLIFIGGTLGGFILGIVVLKTATCPHYPGDPCDGAPMAAMAFWYGSPICSGCVGLVMGIFCLIALRRKSKDLPKIVP